MVPGQGEEFLHLVDPDSGTEGTHLLNETVNNEMIQNLKKIYDSYVEHGMPFMEQVRLLSMLPRSWEYQKVIEIFGVSRHAIKEAHKMSDMQEYRLNEKTEKGIRQRADPEKIKHFVNWLVESDTLISGDYQILLLFTE